MNHNEKKYEAAGQYVGKITKALNGLGIEAVLCSPQFGEYGTQFSGPGWKLYTTKKLSRARILQIRDTIIFSR